MASALYSLVEENVDCSLLSDRVKSLIASAMNYNALLQPGRDLEYRVYMGDKWQYPCLTDFSTLNGGLTENEGLKPFYSAKVTSLVEPQSKFSPHYFGGLEQIVDRNFRYILVTPDDATDADIDAHHSLDFKTRLYRCLEADHPVFLDRLREKQRQKRWADGLKPVVSFKEPDIKDQNKDQYSHHPYSEIHPGNCIEGAQKAVIVGMHWLQAGGAERWAIETVKLVKDAGMLPIVITDRPSHQPWITKPELEGALIINLTFPAQERPGDEPLLRALVEQFDVRGVLVHHCQWLYDRLWWIKKYRPACTVVDSLHIVEYPNCGGYPNQAVSRDAYIDIHHVISPLLVRWLSDGHGISESKIVDAPLVGLTAGTAADSVKARCSSDVMNVAFVGRISRQKRPEAFVLLASEVNKVHPGSFHFIMHGSGDMDYVVDKLIDKGKLGSSIERRSMDVPVSDTYRDADILVISSVNEGITLTTIEALSKGVPVLSANVGSQGTLIPESGLLPRSTKDFIDAAVPQLEYLRNNEEARNKLWRDEMDMLKDFSKLESANSFFSRMLQEWSDRD